MQYLEKIIKKEILKMKKILSSVLACVLVLCTVFTLASCSKRLSGTYKSNEIAGSYTSFEFEGNKVYLKVVVLGMTSDEAIEGTYSIDGDKITFDFGDNEDAEDYSDAMDFVEGEEGDKKYIKIGGIAYYKQ